MRKLASIRKVSKIEPIEKADSLELAHVDGWQCVVGKGQFIVYRSVKDPNVSFKVISNKFLLKEE